MSRIARFLAVAALLWVCANGRTLAATADAYETDNDNAADAAIWGPPWELDALSASTMSKAKAITSGSTQTHSLHTGGAFTGGTPADRDTVKFTLTVASDIMLQTDEDVGPADTVMRLFDNAGTEIGYDDDGNPALNRTSRLVWTDLAAGTYYATVEEYALSGGAARTIESYKLSFVAAATGQRLPPVLTGKSAMPAALGGNFNYTITALGSVPMFYRATGLPTGLALSGGTITGIPTQLGTFSVSLTATNGATPDSTKTITISVTEFGVISSYVGNGSARLAGDNDLAALASLNSPQQVALDSKGNLYIADANNHVIRVVDAQTRIIRTFAGTGLAGYSGDGGPALNARLNNPAGVAVDSTGNVYIADGGNNVIRMVSAATAKIATVAGDGTLTAGLGGDGGLATAAGCLLSFPNGLALDSAGNLYIADSSNHVIRKVTKATGIISRFAGNAGGASGNTGDGGQAALASLNFPYAVAVDGSGVVYIADSMNHRVRRVATNGVITNFAGSATATSGYSGDGGAPTAALLSYPSGLSLDAAGNLYIAEYSNRVIRKVSGGVISSLVGGSATPDYSMTDYGASLTDGGAVLSAVLRSPWSVAVDSTGQTIMISDDLVHRVRMAATATVPVITSSLTLAATKDSPLPAPYRIVATGHPAPAFTATGLPDGLSLHNGVITGVPTQTGIADVMLTATNSRGSDSKVLHITIAGTVAGALAPSDAAAAITVSPNPATVNSTVTFVAPTVVNGADLKEYVWNFGDPNDTAARLGSIRTHAYSAVGVYPVTLTIADGNSTLTLTTTVAINASDVTEKMLLSKAQFKFDFSTQNKDSLAVSGSVPFRKAGAVSGSVISVNVGGITRSYTLGSKGTANGTAGKTDTFKLSAKTSDTAFDPAGLYVMAKFSLAIKAETFSDDLAALGFKKNVTTTIPIKVPILITVNGDSYLETVTIAFKSGEKTGSGAKMKEGGLGR